MHPFSPAMLAQAFAAASPRVSPPPTPLRSTLIGGVVLTLLVFLTLQGLFARGVFAWSAGIAYILYDTALLAFVFWQTRGLGRPAYAPPALPGGPTERPSLGVILAAYNEADVLAATLEALFAQTDSPDRILIADDGSTDDTQAVLSRLYGLSAPPPGTVGAPSATHPTLSWLRVPHAGKARALNAAILALDTAIVMTVDADTLLDPDAIAAARRAFAADPALVAATGILRPVCGGDVAGRFFQWFQSYEYMRNFLSQYAWMRMDSLLLISGALAGFRRAALLAVGGFDPDCLVEDYELIHRLHRHSVRHGLGWRTAVMGAVRARTDAPATVPAFLRQRRRWFAGFLQTQRWYRAMVGDRRYGWLGVLMLPVKAVDTLQPIYGLVAFALLIVFLALGRLTVVLPIAIVIAVKITVDLAFHLWSVHLYRRWTGERGGPRVGSAILASLAEPFSFQLLRHAGAAWGWLVFLTGRGDWGQSRRTGVVPATSTVFMP